MNEHRVKVLIIDGAPDSLEEAVTELSDHFTVYTSSTGEDGLKVFAQLKPEVVIVDAGIEDIPFPDLVENLKGLDGAVLRIAISSDYSVIEKILAAIESTHVHKYFRKPINYAEMIELINARTVNYQVGRERKVATEVGSAYQRLHTIIDKATEAEKLRQQLESQMAKIREVEAESFDRVKEALGEVNRFRKKSTDQEEMIGRLQARSEELDELKKRDIDRIEQEREVLRLELQGLQAEKETLRVSVQQDRQKMLEEMAGERKVLAEELMRMKNEAERAVAVQKERNKAELQALAAAFGEEKQQVTREIERLKSELEENRQARLAGIEEERQRVEQELAGIRARMTEEREQLEKSVQEQREKVEEDLHLFRESAAMEKKKFTQALELDLAARKKAAEAETEERKAAATRDLDRLKEAAQKKERVLSEVLIQTKRATGEMEDQLKLMEVRIKTLESEIEKTINEKELLLRELESLKADFDVAIKSREALVEEVTELRNSLK